MFPETNFPAHALGTSWNLIRRSVKATGRQKYLYCPVILLSVFLFWLIKSIYCQSFYFGFSNLIAILRHAFFPHGTNKIINYTFVTVPKPWWLYRIQVCISRTTPRKEKGLNITKLQTNFRDAIRIRILIFSNTIIFTAMGMSFIAIILIPGLLYHRTCKHDFLCNWPSLNSYLKLKEIFEWVLYPWYCHCIKIFPLF